jgi:hypothetical protein
LGPQDGSFFAKSKKLKLTTLSSTESEYVALCEATREAVWLRRLLKDIGFQQATPTRMWQDNMSTIDMVNGHRNFQASKHINPKFHYTGEMVDDGEIRLEYKATKEMVADVLTKALPGTDHLKFSGHLLNTNLQLSRLKAKQLRALQSKALHSGRANGSVAKFSKSTECSAPRISTRKNGNGMSSLSESKRKEKKH